MQTLTQLNREQGVTIIVVTHEADIAAYADRALTMRDGEIVSDVRNPKHSAIDETARGRTVRRPPAARDRARVAIRPHAIWAFGR